MAPKFGMEFSWGLIFGPRIFWGFVGIPKDIFGFRLLPCIRSYPSLEIRSIPPGIVNGKQQTTFMSHLQFVM